MNNETFWEQVKDFSNIFNLSPLDGRYFKLTRDLRPYFSEAALIKYRVRVEIEFLIYFLENIKKDLSFKEHKEDVYNIYENLSVLDLYRVKRIERTTSHDVKSVELFIGEKLKGLKLEEYIPFVHIFCTSEDINNLAYALMLKEGFEEVFRPELVEVVNKLDLLSNEYANVVMLAHTHGQPATPTTVGKEFANFKNKLTYFTAKLDTVSFMGKFNGASGNYNAHVANMPEVDWIQVSKEFVESLGLKFNLVTSQIEGHAFVADFLSILNNILISLIDINQDIWLYISKNYFKQKVVKGEVGSSVMPHKVNPIFNENAIGNALMATGLIHPFIQGTLISKLQRDLSDSTIFRNLGSILGYSKVSLVNTLRGLNKISVNEEVITFDLHNTPAVILETIQTNLRLLGMPDAYDKLKEFGRGNQGNINLNDIYNFIDSLDIPEVNKDFLKCITPENYVGLAEYLAKEPTQIYF